jgi:hypothetical protein
VHADLHAWLNQQCAAAGPVTIGELPKFEAPDETLREVERVREEWARRG